MKFVFALVALLHMSYGSNFTLNKEIIGRLERLNELYKGGQIIINSSGLLVPTHKMQTNAEFCVSVFKKELLEFLNNVTVKVEEKQHLIEEVKDNLNLLVSDDQMEVDERCKSKPMSRNALFKAHIVFLKSLNNRKRDKK